MKTIRFKSVRLHMAFLGIKTHPVEPWTTFFRPFDFKAVVVDGFLASKVWAFFFAVDLLLFPN